MAKPLNILFLSHRVPFPPNKGEKIRSFNELRHLSRNHQIHLLAFCDQPDELGHARELQKYCRTVTLIPLNRHVQYLRAATAMLRGRPWSLGYFNSPRMYTALQDLMRKESIDRIFVYCSSMAGYVEDIKGIPKILDFVDSDALKWRQYSEKRSAPSAWLYAYEARKLLQYEHHLIQTFDHSIFVSSRELSGHELKTSQDKVSFIQNGINLDFFKPGGGAGPSPGPGIAFTGAMDYYPNIDGVLYFANEIFPEIQKQCADAQFFIIGSRPVNSIRKLASIPGITVTGTVDDVRPFLSQCRVAVVPLRIAQGIQNKILEALASGLPVVTTPIAAGSLGNNPELPVTLASSPKLFAKHVLDYIHKAPLSSDAIQTARDYLSNHYSWHSNLAALDEIISAPLSNKKTGP
ncbi:MAG: TIGR03087 family PEP-CTERM/XrtA system glycosyltransferase [Acidobacteriota bacterium]|jgi:sugar transferase (PEP-CTERM/EpsH1 system associated)|nr:TIGR03087 family PEP-CTERM/XrtA system glycosyltransferase [Acidobacteriota bacterium]NLT33768.1 TIGR03087 family PEP-CTERM/XrtA system glycosyltransferase [Acidobacteriota bacterium]